MSFRERNSKFPHWISKVFWKKGVNNCETWTNQNTWETRDFVFDIIYTIMDIICPIISNNDADLNKKYFTILGTLINQITNWVLKFQKMGTAYQIVPQSVITMVLTDASYWANNGIMFCMENYTNADQFIAFLITYIRTLETLYIGKLGTTMLEKFWCINKLMGPPLDWYHIALPDSPIVNALSLHKHRVGYLKTVCILIIFKLFIMFFFG